ncbi:uncharacterized protein EDB93DRAFT_1253578 [Suillus bovinus]|uniref:uncharacterized protein n=1 Tax=Suillus bovinus TaxID=48563 RepID=UPI001B878C7A|nr:uncharacterized protein EDB93DRAFT_1253578 [Suillus bovinus]KAG2137567.1 hypothetical protein EDB93DRAFT_1253578 [Suillus bovinus]
MLPITEFQFAFCGIATFAATFGYACARRASSLSAQPSRVDVEPEEKSLKRKLDESDAESEEEQERPVKRSRTPPNDHEEEEWEVVIPPPSYQEAQNAAPHPEPLVRQEVSTISQVGIAQVEEVAPSVDEPAPEAHIPSAIVVNENVQPVEPQEAESQTKHPEYQSQSLRTNEPSEPRPVTPLPPASKSVTLGPNITAFSSFANTKSPFTKYSNTPFPSSTSAFAPAWRCGESRTPNFPVDNAHVPCPNDNALSPSPNEVAETSSAGALGDRAQASTSSKVSSLVTGEEDESVSSELKGVKIFIKRGRKEFTNGNFGHIKVLTQNERTRLLFRRDPLGQVSMNVALRSAVRCHYDTGENILRVVLMEQVAVEGKEPKDEVVIYALKPGRASKADFKVFAETLCANESLKAAI